ncbi:gem-associated protein 8 isoform X1 [Nannospalax galili]|uniref:Gem nuclear organelle associated protein 8 n=1 Tax=Nannospalax galili TaxID=1026970 RepID=A0A8C6RZ38_NANGA|nr:gem-associated protein 8 isoform X1 [Nannospalax galili]XP_008851098.1 gem-associated protein 8 isoform X1 [Nannospalax galili]
MASSWSAPTSWYSHPIYARYWQHYHLAMAWMQSHQNAYRNAREHCLISPWYVPQSVLPWSTIYYEAGDLQSQAFQGQHTAWQNSHYSSSHFESSGQPLHDSSRAQPYAREDQALYEEEEVESESDDGIECDLSNMEITDELRQFFAETERHREERRQQQKLDAERLGDYVNADHGLYCDYQRSAEPPSERPGERRQAEMKRLYGDSAAKILAMEAAVQLNFDKCCDRKQPKYWPVIPLKF